MFTGIIEEIGKIVSIQKGQRSSVLMIEGSVIFDDLKIGDSVAVNGVCLTVNAFEHRSFTADVMSETLRRSALGTLKIGSLVNLERAMLTGSRFGGHIVSGHIDGTGTITGLRRDDNAIWITIQTTEEIIKLIVEKGSICIDGISLTVASVLDAAFNVSIIPHTAKATTLAQKKIGDPVNLENDIIGKYVQRLLSFESANEKPESKLTEAFLAEAGFY